MRTGIGVSAVLLVVVLTLGVSMAGAPQSSVPRRSPALPPPGSSQASVVVPRSAAPPAPEPPFSTGIPEGSDYETWIRENEPDLFLLQFSGATERPRSGCASGCRQRRECAPQEAATEE